MFKQFPGNNNVDINVSNKHNSFSVDINTSKTNQSVNVDMLSADKHFTYVQSFASDEWVIEHNLQKHPSVTIVDSAGTVVIGDVLYLSVNKLVVSFSAPFSGKAYLN